MLAASAAPAYAQSGAAPTASAGDRTGLEEIVVTASRRNELVQKSSLPISVFSGDALAQAGVTTAKDLSSLSPGVNIAQAGSQTQVYIRGVGSDAANGLADGAISFNVDGVYISRPAAINSSFYDISRVEVVKGPQGTLYGKNATGGAINVITRNPEIGDFSGDISLELGDYSLETVQAGLNLPVNDKLAMRGAFYYAHHEGYLSDGTDDENTMAGRLKALLEPTDDLSILLSLDYAHEGGKGGGVTVHPAITGDPWLGAATPQTNALIAYSPLGGSYPGSPFGHLGPNPTPYGLLTPILNNDTRDNRRWGVSVDAEWDLGFATLTVIPAFRQAPSNYNTWAPGFEFDNVETDKQLSVEARLSHQSDSLKWVVGIYYFNENQGLYLFNFQGPIGIGAAVTPLLNDDNYAGFGEATYTVLDGLRGIVGLRYTHEDKQIHGEDIDLIHPGNTFGFAHSVSFNATTWKAGFEYDVLPASMLYFTASTGFKSGGFYPNAGPDNYAPEKLTAYELGIKNRFLDNTLELNVEAFDWDYTGRQFSHLAFVTTPAGVPLNFLTYGTFNAGVANIEGFDVTGKYKVTPDDTLSVDAEYNHSEYTDFAYSQPFGYASPASTACILGPNKGGFQSINCSGRPLSRAPLWSGSIGWMHRFDLDGSGSVEASINAHLSSGYWIAIDYIPSERASGYSRSDFDLTYRPQSGAWSLSGYVHNLENAAVYTGGSEHPFVSGLTLATIMPPRTFGARFTLDF
jgi:iron complex outermembrane receptor protein